MKITENTLEFESPREQEIFLMLLREVNIGELRPEIHKECVDMLDNVIQGLTINKAFETVL